MRDLEEDIDRFVMMAMLMGYDYSNDDTGMVATYAKQLTSMQARLGCSRLTMEKISTVGMILVRKVFHDDDCSENVKIAWRNLFKYDPMFSDLWKAE